ncbi:MAG: hypothetical protein ACJAWV_004525, partial [Flammeovirgaceae bacterium]
MKKKIEEFNHYLLTNYRLIWETKIIFLLLYLIPSYLLVSTICLAYPVSLKDYWADYEDFAMSLTVCVSVVNALIFFFWIHKNSQYRIERDFGFNFKFIEQSRFLLYFAGVSLLMVQPFLPTYILNQKVDGLISYEELTEDIKMLNEGNIYFPLEIVDGYVVDNDNVFYSLQEHSSEDVGNYYEYNETYFGSSEYIAETSVVEARSRMSNKNSAEYYQKLIDKAIADERAIQKIQAYIVVVNKYAYSSDPEFFEPKEVFQNFQKRNTGYGDQIRKEAIRQNIRTIVESKQQIANSENAYIFLSLLLGAFSLTVLVQIGKHIGLKIFLLAIIFNIGLSMSFGITSAILGFGGLQLAFVAPFLVFAFLLFQTFGILRLKTKQSLKVISLSTLQVYSPFFLFYLFSMVGLGNMNGV